MATNLKLERLSTSELLDIRDYVDALLTQRVSRERQDIERMLARIEEADEGDDAAPRRRRPPSKIRGRKVAPKYRNPETRETWAGRGMRPRWLEGKKLEQYAIDKAGAGRPRGARRRRKKRR